LTISKAERDSTTYENPLHANFRELPFLKLSKKSGQRQDEGLRSPRSEAKRGLFRCVMPAIPTLETPPSDFLDSFSTHSGE
jgi:hypothetical protein